MFIEVFHPSRLCWVCLWTTMITTHSVFTPMVVVVSHEQQHKWSLVNVETHYNHWNKSDCFKTGVCVCVERMIATFPWCVHIVVFCWIQTMLCCLKSRVWLCVKQTKTWIVNSFLTNREKTPKVIFNNFFQELLWTILITFVYCFIVLKITGY